MVRIRIIAVGKDKTSWVIDACAHYRKLLSRYGKLEWVIVPGVRTSGASSPQVAKRKEAERLLDKVGKGFTIALADTGVAMDSLQLSREVERWQIVSGETVNIIIGGPYGLDASVLEQSDVVLSLSPLTFSHQVVRPVLLEQLFRAFSILAGTDYHK